MSAERIAHLPGADNTLRASDIRNTITEIFPGIERHWDLPLRDYARLAYETGSIGPLHPVRQDAASRLLRRVQEAALRAGHTPAEAKQARDQLEKVPVLQTGPHCHLLIEPDAFYTHQFSLLGLGQRGLRWHHWYACSTVKLTERSRRGPGWLRIDGCSVNVFRLSRRRMEKLSVCGPLDKPIRFELASKPEDDRGSATVRALCGMLPDDEFHSAGEAIRTANLNLWKVCMAEDSCLLQLDDSDMADLVADHLDDPSSWLSTHFCGKGGFGEALLTCLAVLDEGPWHGWIRLTTDLFWGLSDGRILPLRLSQAVLRSACGRMTVSFDRNALASALHRRKIVPSLLMTFLVLSVLPGIRVLGGCRQIIYYPLMRHVISAALDRSGFPLLRAELNRDGSPGVWGHRVLKPAGGEPMAEIQKSDVRARLAGFGDVSLREACGDMGSFTGDPLWNGLVRAVASGTIASTSPELLGGQIV